MSYLALYRKYRPGNFDEVVGQKFIVKILKNSVLNTRLSHAYLFSGPRGTGKTSIAKLIAKVINCENLDNYLPCEKCSSCLAFNQKSNPDIIEIDAASNNGVDEIREIRDKVSLVPTLSKYKIYIIDEVHMLSIGAFNALLKTLEEPPAHVVFILATTEFYKVPETIVSRCQCFEFERLNVDEIVSKLKEITKKEKINVEKEVLELIAQYSDGGLRDAINMLDKLSCTFDEIKVSNFYELKGLVNKEDFDYITKNLVVNNVNNVLEKVDEINIKGKNIILLAEELLLYLKDEIINRIVNNKSEDYSCNNLYESLDIMNNVIINMKKSSYPKVIFEVGLLKIMSFFSSDGIKADVVEITSEPLNKIISVVDEVEVVSNIVSDDSLMLEDADIEETVGVEEIKTYSLIEGNRHIRVNNAFALADKSLLSDLRIRWVNFSDYLHNKEFSSVVSYLMDGTLRVAGKNYIIISVKYGSILENALKNIGKIETLFNIVIGDNYKIAFVLDEEWDEMRKKYVEDKNSGIIYEVKDELEVKEESVVINKDDLGEVVNDAISLFGDDVVEIN